jgi:hypothetical protein
VGLKEVVVRPGDTLVFEMLKMGTFPERREPADAALDVRRAVYYRRSVLDPAPPGAPHPPARVPRGGAGAGGGQTLATFDATMRNTWYTRFYQIQPIGGTPLRMAQERIGEYYRAGTSPTGGAVPDPIQYSCQQNYHLLTTDGQWNGTGATGARATTNYDRTLPSGNPDLLKALGSEFNTTFAAGANWPALYRENATTSSVNNLSDLAAYYWMTDLRPTMPNNVFTGGDNGMDGGGPDFDPNYQMNPFGDSP